MIIARGTDWRFLDELKKELKGWNRGSRTAEQTSEPGVLRRGEHWRMSRRTQLVCAPVVLALLATGSGPPTVAAHPPGQEARLATIGPAPAWSLTQNAERLSLSDLLGKVVVLTFLYTRCPDACPLLTAKMAAVRTKLGADFGSRVVFGSVTVDPERDTPAVLARYAEAHGIKRTGWAFLTGSPEEIRDVARRYGVYYKRGDRGEVDHTFLTSVIDGAAMLRVQYVGVRFDPDELLRDIRSLLREARAR
jgi:protein SCO1